MFAYWLSLRTRHSDTHHHFDASPFINYAKMSMCSLLAWRVASFCTGSVSSKWKMIILAEQNFCECVQIKWIDQEWYERSLSSPVLGHHPLLVVIIQEPISQKGLVIRFPDQWQWPLIITEYTQCATVLQWQRGGRAICYVHEISLGSVMS